MPTPPRNVSAFAQGYLTCLCWTEGIPDLPDAERAEAIRDADAFATVYRDALDVANEEGRDDEHLGHDFWLTRNGHGTGFWDRGLGHVGERLTAAAAAAGERDYSHLLSPEE